MFYKKNDVSCSLYFSVTDLGPMLSDNLSGSVRKPKKSY